MKRMKAAVTYAAVVLVLIVPSSALAQQAIGTIIMMEGSAEVGRDGDWQSASAGTGVRAGDTIRTGQPGRVRVTFQDDSTITIGDDSVFVIEKSVFDPNEGAVTSYMRLLKGKIRALVSEYYKDPLASYTIETATAVSGVRGTDFIVDYDEAGKVTDVVGITGRVEVHGTIDRKAHGVFITSGQATRVVHGKLPTAARALAADEMRRHLDSLYLLGSDAGVSADDPVLTGGEIPLEDRPVAAPGASPPVPVTPPAAGDAGGIDRSSPGDVAGQPIGAVENAGNIGVPFLRSGPP